MYFHYAENIAEWAANTMYGNNIDVVEVPTLSAAFGRVLQQKPVFLGINGSTTYFDHAVVLMGYRLYEYTEGWWIFARTYSISFLEVADGWYNDSKFLDINTDSNITMVMYCIT